jgi:hypothetical protein
VIAALLSSDFRTVSDPFPQPDMFLGDNRFPGVWANLASPLRVPRVLDSRSL